MRVPACCVASIPATHMARREATTHCRQGPRQCPPCNTSCTIFPNYPAASRPSRCLASILLPLRRHVGLSVILSAPCVPNPSRFSLRRRQPRPIGPPYTNRPSLRVPSCGASGRFLNLCPSHHPYPSGDMGSPPSMHLKTAG